MKYAREVIDLMAAFPGRQFRMRQVVRYANGGASLDKQATNAVRKAVGRVLDQLITTGSITVVRGHRGQACIYTWKGAVQADCAPELAHSQ